METMEDRKRTYSEQSSSSSDKSPPPKRQLLSSQQSRPGQGVNGQATSSSSSSNSYQDFANLDISDPKWLECYQKEAIIRALREYKRESERINKWNEQLKEKQINYEDHLSVINRCWNKLLNDLRMIISRVDEDGNLSSLIPSDVQLKESKFLAQISQFEQDDGIIEIIEESLTEKFGITKKVITVLLEKIIAWIEQRNKLIKFLQSEKDPMLKENKVIQSLKNENESLNLLNKRNQKDLDELHVQHHTVSFEMSTIKYELEKTKNRLEEVEGRLEITKDELAQAEKRFDRSKSVTLGLWTHPGSNIFGSSSAYENDKIKNLPEDRIIDSQVYRSLQVQYFHCKDTYDYMRTVMEQNSREMEKMTATRNSATNQIQEETKQTIKETEDQLNKLLFDLDRIRAQRDDVSMEVDKLRAMLPQEFRQISALRVLANDRKTIIRQLMTEIQRLNMKIAANEGNKQAIDFYCTPAEPPDVTYEEIQQGKNSFELIKRQLSYDHHLQEELNKSEKIRIELQREIDELKNNFEMGDYHDIIASKARLKQEVEELKSRLDEYDEKYGIKDPGDDPLHILTSKIGEAERKIEKIESDCDYLKKNEKQLLQELEVLGDHWARQDQENTVKVFEIIAHDERLQNARESEAKVKQKLNSIWMENVSLKKQKNHLSTVIQNQTDLLRQKGYLEENLKSQLDNANKELGCSKQVVDVHKLKLHEFTQQNKDLKEKIERNMTTHNELKKQLEESIKSCEKEAHKSRRLAEEVEMYKRQAEDHRRTQVSDTTEQQLIQNYEKLLKCSSCAIRFKSHCLLKCMHTFCKECLEAQEKARNRKCAKCGLPFSSTDIKQLFH
ncbi:16111_t:CDS:10 [Funneliformis caledonium]|uniref:E3 ubiquitin protein ligase n=1 Tax=Funneliformis caledonium TaxID=1117310 RepID=A0A9N9BH16_9GLOM|nr:16111_t:CDS:10 [Funneliformis caledonium]